MSQKPEPLTEEQEQLWRNRESQRFVDGTYQQVVWVGETWFQGSLAVFSHYLHVSNEDPSQLAFTENPHKGFADRQTRMKPGRYLTRFFLDVLGTEGVHAWAERFAATHETENEVKFATTPGEIIAVYQNGPRSCMSRSASVGVYGAGDLAVAYLGDAHEHVTARVVCWPERMIFNRIYGDAPRLRRGLEDLGYGRGVNGAFAGARLEVGQDKSSGMIVAPYWDGPESGSVRDIDGQTYLVLQASGGEYSLRSTEGFIGGMQCAACGERMSEDDATTVGDETWCTSCSEQTFYCERCDRRLPDHFYGGFDDQSWCTDCVESNTTMCDQCGERVWETSTVGTDEVCEQCAEDYSQCEHCDEPTRDGLHEVYGGINWEMWCQGCVDSDSGTCLDCPGGRDQYSTDELAEIDGDTYCPDCAESHEAEAKELTPNAGPVLLLTAGSNYV